jgi:hypothetical protein
VNTDLPAPSFSSESGGIHNTVAEGQNPDPWSASPGDIPHKERDDI